MSPISIKFYTDHFKPGQLHQPAGTTHPHDLTETVDSLMFLTLFTHTHTRAHTHHVPQACCCAAAARYHGNQSLELELVPADMGGGELHLDR